MNQPENQGYIEENLENLSDFEVGKIKNGTGSSLFETIGYDEKKLDDFIQKFEDIYYLSVLPGDIEKYKNNQAIYNILNRYKHTAEGHRLEIMIFKVKEISEEERHRILKELKEEYGFDIQLDESKYEYIVGYFGGTAGRTCSYYMDEIKKIYPVKILK